MENWHNNALQHVLAFTLLIISTCATPDGSSLLRAKSAWNANLPSWVGADPCQSWEGVGCDANQRVISLNLSNKGIVGPIPTEIGDLQYLKSLDLSTPSYAQSPVNHIEGDLSALAGLTNLQSLNLSFNNITLPRFPSAVLNLTNLIVLRLDNNDLAGPIPSELSKLANLTVLRLDTNHLTEPIPPELSKLANLEYLNLSDNNIQLPQFPSMVLSLTNLIDLRLDNNKLSGPIPPDLSKLAKLQYLYLGNNTLQGPLPPEFGNLVNLLELSLWNNVLSSEIPHEFGKLIKLRYLNLHSCGLYGGLPMELGNLRSIETLSLYQNPLTGTIPNTWKSLTNLRVLKLYDNHLTKSFPQWIQDLPNIYNVSLAQNYFYGPVANLSSSTKLHNLGISCNFFDGSEPTSYTTIINDTGNCFSHSDPNLKIKCDQQAYANCDSFLQAVSNGGCPVCPSNQILQDSTTCVCTMSHKADGKSSLIQKLVSSIVGVGLFLIFAGLLCWRWIRMHRTYLRYHESEELNRHWEAPEGVQCFTLQELAKATHNFNSSHEIGEGGFGKVFYGLLDNGKKIAVKRASSSSIQSSSAFHNEVLLLSRLHHRNLVHLVGCCEDNGIQILVYEYMTNGNLHTLLFKNHSGMALDWLRRLDIALGVAQGLEYLHSFADPPVIHRDVKPSNILLDEHLVAKLSDFGISKVAPEFETHFSTRPAGTVGYIDPQYFLRHHLTTASDVYSFGMVLLELVSGQKCIDKARQDDHNLVEWVKLKLNTHGLKGIVDPRLGDGYPEQIYQDLVRLGIDCASFSSEDRPSMKAVLTILDACRWAISPQLLQEVHEGHDWSSQGHGSIQSSALGRASDTERSKTGSISSFSVSFPSPR